MLIIALMTISPPVVQAGSQLVSVASKLHVAKWHILQQEARDTSTNDKSREL